MKSRALILGFSSSALLVLAGCSTGDPDSETTAAAEAALAESPPGVQQGFRVACMEPCLEREGADQDGTPMVWWACSKECWSAASTQTQFKSCVANRCWRAACGSVNPWLCEGELERSLQRCARRCSYSANPSPFPPVFPAECPLEDCELPPGTPAPGPPF